MSLGRIAELENLAISFLLSQCYKIPSHHQQLQPPFTPHCRPWSALGHSLPLRPHVFLSISLPLAPCVILGPVTTHLTFLPDPQPRIGLLGELNGIISMKIL